VLDLLLILALGVLPQAPAGVYQAVFLRAAPGHLLELVDAIKARMPVYDAAGLHRPLLLRHAQGDQWDLMLLAPIGSVSEHFGSDRATRWRDAVRRSGFDDPAFMARAEAIVSWSEELYVTGPPVAALDSATAGRGYFHLEVFQALAGKRDSLHRQRLMENRFLADIGRPTNLVFRKITGPSWDLFTLGFYRDLQHYAEPTAVSAARVEQAARAAGFASRDHIGPYLRQFLSGHHDTLGGIVR
jgi:hypothetical protein